MIIIINGPSGSGKTTLGEYFATLGLQEIISTTTRPPREGEIPGKSYYFVTEEEFLAADRIEESFYAGHYYGVTRREVEARIGDGASAYASLDINGVRRFKELYPDDTVVLYLKVSRRLIKKRMARRGDSIANIRRRLEHHRATREDLNHQYADYIIYNHGSLRDLQNQGRQVLEQEGVL